MTGLSRRLKKLEHDMRPSDAVFSFMDLYNEIHRLALERLMPAERTLCQDWPQLNDCPRSLVLTPDQQQTERRWVAAFNAVRQEVPGSFSICAYDRWL